MKTNELLEIVKARGLSLRLDDDRRPILRRPDGNKNATDALLAVLRRHRERIIEHLIQEKLP